MLHISAEDPHTQIVDQCILKLICNYKSSAFMFIFPLGNKYNDEWLIVRELGLQVAFA